MAPDNITLKRTTSNDPDFRHLVTYLDKDLQDRYGALQSVYSQYNHLHNLDTVLIAYRDQNPVGCGCFKDAGENKVEIKRMFVKADARGQGIASSILTALETWAKETGITHTVLETGDKQHEAIALYQKLGYTTIPNYGQYAGMESSVCMQKEL